MRRRILPFVAVTAAAMLTLTACAGGEDGPAAEGEQSLVVARAENLTTLDSDAVSASAAGSETLELIADALFDLDPQTSAIVPKVASGYEYSDDNLSLTVTVREGAVFNNGDPVTSADVKFTLENAAKGPLQGALYAGITSIETPDDQTVVINYAEADSSALLTLAGYTVAVVPADFGGKTAEEFWLEPVTVGPYKIESWDQGQQITLVPNELYYGEQPKLSSLTFVGVPDENTRLLQLQNGTAQLIDAVSPAQVPSVEGDASVEIVSFPSATDWFITLNTTVAPFDDVHARRAVSLAINRDDLVKVALQGLGEPGGSPIVPAGLGGYSPEFGTLFDLEQAKQELAQSNSPDGFSFNVLYDSDSPSGLVSALQVMQEQLAEAGITLVLEGLDPNATAARMEANDWNSTTASITSGGDAGAVLQYYEATNGFFSGETEVMAEVSNLYAQANADFSGQEARTAVFREAVDLIAETAVQISLYDDLRIWAASPKVDGIELADAAGTIDFTKVFLTN